MEPCSAVLPPIKDQQYTPEYERLCTMTYFMLPYCAVVVLLHPCSDWHFISIIITVSYLVIYVISYLHNNVSSKLALIGHEATRVPGVP